MTPQENHALQELLQQLTQVRGIAKDPDADALIRRAVAEQPDAAYLLVQRAMLLEQALTAAKARISQLENELEASRRATRSGNAGGASAGGSFLESATAWGRSAVSPARGAATPAAQGQMPIEQQAPMQSQGMAPQAARPGFLGGGGSGFLGNMAATAAGVAGGAFLFHGIGSLLGNHGPGSSLAGQQGMAPDSASLAKNDSATENAHSDNASDSEPGLSDADYSDSGGFDGFDSGGDTESI